MQCNAFSLIPPLGVAAVKDSVPLSPLRPSPADTEQNGAERGNPALGKDPLSPHVSLETSNPQPQMPKAEVEVTVGDDEASSPLTISEFVYRSSEFNMFQQ